MRIMNALAALAATLVIGLAPVPASAQEGGHGAMHGAAHGHGEHAAKVETPAAESKTVDVWVCSGDETTGLSWEAPCPLDGKPAVKKTLERSSFKDLKNAKCPIMGGDTDPTIFALHKGKAVHLCCPDCAEGFFKDPVGHIAKLEKGAGAKAEPHEGRHGGHH